MMRKFLFPVFIFVSLLSVAQTDTIAKDQVQVADSILSRKQQISDSILHARALEEKERMDASNKRNMDYILHLQKEQKAKQKKAAIIRLVIGILLLALLIIGLRRRRKN